MDSRCVRLVVTCIGVVFATLGWTLTAVSGASATVPIAQSATGYAQIRHACAPASAEEATCFALVRDPTLPGNTGSPATEPYKPGDGASSSGPAGGLTPGQLASAYGYSPESGGSGQTVAVIEAYDDPKLEEDLGQFDAEYGLPPCTAANGCFEKVGQAGSPSSLPSPDTKGWSIEASLDVETVHGACPSCKILVVEAKDALYADLAAAANEAVSLGATEVSNSYGGPEKGMGATEQADYNHPGVVITAATGDEGYDDWDLINDLEEYEGKLYFGLSPEMPNAPASLPSVVAVGGTTLELNEDGTRARERVWNSNGPGDEYGVAYGPQGATGGGCSTRFIAQPWQQGTPGFGASGCGSKRLGADISADANPQTGFAIYDSYDCGSSCEADGVGGGWVTIGGTSLSTPLISALYALAGGSDGVQYPALALYGHLEDASSLYDVTEGANGLCDGESVAACGDPNGSLGQVDCEGTSACNAGSGYDGPSGVGTPNGLAAFKPLLPTATIDAPGSLKEGAIASFSATDLSDPYPGGSVSSYSWNWGDGTPGGSGGSATHTFARAGSYVVTLTVTDTYGLMSAQITRMVEVGEKSPEEEAKQHEEVARQAQETQAAENKKREEEKSLGGATANGGGAQGVAGFQAHIVAPVPDALLAGTTLSVSSSGLFSVKISCPAGETECVGTLTFRTLDVVRASARKKPAILALATGSFTVRGGSVMTVTLHLTSEARTLLLRLHLLKARATILARDSAGATHSSQATAELRLVKAKHVRG